MHLLCLKPELEVLLPGYDLYVFDEHSWSCIRALLNLLGDTHFFNGLADGCLVPDQNECRFAWTLRHNTPHYHSVDNSVFHWCLIPPEFKQLLESYAICKTLHMGCVFGISQAMNENDYVQCFAEVIKINLVMTLSTDLKFFSSICTSLSSNASFGMAECSKEVCRPPSSPRHQCLEPVTQIIDNNIGPYGSKDFSPIITCTQCKEMCTSNDILPSVPVADVEVYENNLDWIKNEQAADENREDKIEEQLSYHVVQGTKATLEKNVVRKMLQFENVLQIAKNYAALSCSKDFDYAFHPFPPHKVKGTKIILECPRCNIPSSCTSSSALIKLLRHVKRRHPTDCDTLFADIVERYAPLIESMERKVASRKTQTPRTKQNK